MEIGIIIVLIAGLAASLIWGVGLKKKRDAADRLNTQLKGERDAAKQSIAQLEGERNDAKRRSTELDSKLKAEEQRSTELDNQLDVTNRRIAELDSQLVEANQRNVELDTQLSAEKQHSAELDTQLTVEKQRSADLDSKLKAEEQRSAQLDSQLTVANRRISELDRALGVANRRSTGLETELQQVGQSNNNAIQLLYLTTLSLQACGFALRRELDRSKRLDENYRNLAEAYNGLVDDYGNFRDDVSSRAKRRMVKKGVGFALAFIPGLALIDILSDLGDIISVVSEAEEAVDVLDVDIDSIHESVESSGEEVEVSESGKPIEGVSFLPLIPNAQTGVEETVQENVSIESTTRDPSNLDAFVTDILKFMKDLVNSLTEDEHRAAIAEMINNLQELDYKLRYPCKTDDKRTQSKSR